MRYCILFLLSAFLLAACSSDRSEPKIAPDYALVIHGGAGNIATSLPDSIAEIYHTGLDEALKVGEDVLKNGGSALDAVQATIEVMEANPIFNAGKGAVYNAQGKQEMDASIMDGSNIQAGAVAGVSRLKSPIQASRLVMDSSRHVMLSGQGAEEFAFAHGLEEGDSAYFWNEKRYNQWMKASGKLAGFSAYWDDRKFGTVGACALDSDGNLAAGTSTGGMTNKKFGRIGDSPIIGAGTYAKNGTCAVSCTGRGEDFIRLNIARDVAAMMEYRGLSLQDAAHETVHVNLEKIQGSGGLIALDQQGQMAMPFNTTGMFRGFVRSGENRQTYIH